MPAVLQKEIVKGLRLFNKEGTSELHLQLIKTSILSEKHQELRDHRAAV